VLIDICVPASGGEYMDAVVVVQWCVATGQPVKAGQTLVVVETAKTSIDIDAPAGGVMGDILVREGTEAPIGGVLARLMAEEGGVAALSSPATSEAVDAGAAATGAAAAGAAAAAAAPAHAAAPAAAESASAQSAGKTARADAPDPADATAASAPAAGRQAVSPAARKAARERGLDLTGVKASSPTGRIKLRDLPPARAASQPDSGLYLQRRGGGLGDPIVFIHGFGGDTVSWTPLLAFLNADRPAVLLDLPSHGRSARRKVQSVQDLADCVAATLHAQGLDKVHLVGHSLGGAVAMLVAADGSIDVRSLALLAPAGLGRDVNGGFIRGFAQAADVLALTPWLRMLVADTGLIDDTIAALAMEARADPALRQAQQDMAEALFAGASTLPHDLRDVLMSLDMPRKIIWGELDRIIPWRHALGLDGASALHLLPGVGHVPQFEAAQRVADLIDELVRSAS